MTTRARDKAEQAAKRKSLSPLQRLFALEYIVDLNGTRAAIRAGYSARTAAQQAHQLLRNPLVLAEIDVQKKARLKRIAMDADALLLRLFEEADADLADLYDDDGNLLPVKDWPAIWRKGLVAGIETEEILGPSEEDGKPKPVLGFTRKIKLADRMKRLEAIGRHVNVQAWKDRKEVSADAPLRQLLEQIGGSAIRPKEPGG